MILQLTYQVDVPGHTPEESKANAIRGFHLKMGAGAKLISIEEVCLNERGENDDRSSTRG